MRAPSGYILQRLQQIFSDRVLNDDQFIMYSDLPKLVRAKALRSSFFRYSPYRQAIKEAVVDEICLGRISLDVDHLPARLCFTVEGIEFYRHYRAPFAAPRRVQPPREDGPFRQAAITEYVTVVDTFKSMQEIVRLFVGDVRELEARRLPSTIRSRLESEQNLRAENTTLVLNLNELCAENDNLRERAQVVDDSDNESSIYIDETRSLMYPSDDDEDGMEDVIDLTEDIRALAPALSGPADAVAPPGPAAHAPPHAGPVHARLVTQDVIDLTEDIRVHAPALPGPVAHAVAPAGPAAHAPVRARLVAQDVVDLTEDLHAHALALPGPVAHAVAPAGPAARAPAHAGSFHARRVAQDVIDLTEDIRVHAPALPGPAAVAVAPAGPAAHAPAPAGPVRARLVAHASAPSSLPGYVPAPLNVLAPIRPLALANPFVGMAAAPGADILDAPPRSDAFTASAASVLGVDSAMDVDSALAGDDDEDSRCSICGGSACGGEYRAA